MAKGTCPASQTISYEELKEFGKTHLRTPVTQQYLNDDVVVVVRSHVSFLEAVAPFTKRLNASSVGRMVKEQYQMSQLEANMFGAAMCQAFSHCMRAGGKATDGTKLPKRWWLCIRHLWNAPHLQIGRPPHKMPYTQPPPLWPILSHRWPCHLISCNG